ncbi:MAG: molybdopterin molybdotransferase MoeA [Bacteroidota bacterium]
MITVAEVDNLIKAALLSLGEEKVSLASATGKILKEKVLADRDFPPFNRVMMDGIAIQYDVWKEGNKEFKIEGLSAAGTTQISLSSGENCLEVMTGAVMPANADTVVKYEEVTIEDGVATINVDHVIKQGQHVHLQGMDRKEGDLLLEPDRVISAAEIATLATVGVTEVTVAKTPKVAVIATGDELVEIEQTPETHQIRKSNVHSLIAALERHEIRAEAFHFIDNKDAIRRGLAEILDFFDVVVLSGGVSKGKLDYVPEILDELGVKKDFHFVKQRPGKPFWFGRYKKGVVFALPGNPVSSFVGLTRYVVPFLYRSTGVEPKAVKAMLTEDFTFKPDLTYYLQVSLQYSDDGRLLATPVPGRGSGDLANLLDADAFLELPQGKNLYEKGDVFRCWEFRR